MIIALQLLVKQIPETPNDDTGSYDEREYLNGRERMKLLCNQHLHMFTIWRKKCANNDNFIPLAYKINNLW